MLLLTLIRKQLTLKVLLLERLERLKMLWTYIHSTFKYARFSILKESRRNPQAGWRLFELYRNYLFKIKNFCLENLFVKRAAW